MYSIDSHGLTPIYSITLERSLWTTQEIHNISTSICSGFFWNHSSRIKCYLLHLWDQCFIFWNIISQSYLYLFYGNSKILGTIYTSLLLCDESGTSGVRTVSINHCHHRKVSHSILSHHSLDMDWNSCFNWTLKSSLILSVWVFEKDYRIMFRIWRAWNPF